MFKKLAPKIEQEKAAVVGTEIIAPMAEQVVVRIDGLKFWLPADGGNDSHSLGLWEITPTYRARFKGIPNRQAVIDLFNRFPQGPMIWLGNNRCHVFNLADTRFTSTITVENPLDVTLDTFTAVTVVFWAERAYILAATNRNRNLASTLQQYLTNQTPPARTSIADPAYRSAYQHVYADIDPVAILQKAAVNRGTDPRQYVQDALNRGGATLVNLLERSNGWTVEYQLPDVSDHEIFTAVFNRDFKMLAPGLCFRSNQDLGLTEFVALVREGFQHGHGDWRQRWND